MALRQILTEPNKILREKSSLVEKVDENCVCCFMNTKYEYDNPTIPFCYV